MQPKATTPTPSSRQSQDPDALGLRDVALVQSGRPDHIPRETARRLAAAVRTDPRFADLVEELEALAQQAGYQPVRDEDLEAALDCRRDFERLLEAEDWEHPSEVLDPEGDLGIPYRELAHLAAARAEESAQMAAVNEKIVRAWARQRERDAPVMHFVSSLLEHDEETAEQLLQQAVVEHRRRRLEATRA